MGFLDRLMTKIDGVLGRGAPTPVRMSNGTLQAGRTARTPGAGRRLPREARKWLRGNRSEYGFAPNAFGKTANALAYVEKLYAAGAKEVKVGKALYEPWRIAETGGPHADELFVTVRGPKAKKQINAFVKRNSDNYEPDEKSWKGNTLRLWWD